jgi:hypothetical protein
MSSPTFLKASFLGKRGFFHRVKSIVPPAQLVPYRSEIRERSPTFIKASIERLGLFSLIVFLVIVSLPAQLIPYRSEIRERSPTFLKASFLGKRGFFHRVKSIIPPAQMVPYRSEIRERSPTFLIPISIEVGIFLCPLVCLMSSRYYIQRDLFV